MNFSLAHAVKIVIVFERGFSVIIAGPQKQVRDRLVLAADGKNPLVVSVKILIAVGIRPVDPFDIRLDQNFAKGKGRTGAYFHGRFQI